MKKFVFVYQGRGMTNYSKEEMKTSMDRWMQWFGTFQDKMVDGGNPFAPGGKVVTAKGVKQFQKELPATPSSMQKTWKKQ